MVLIGHVDQIACKGIEGWAIDTSCPDDVVSISVFVNGGHRGSCLTSHTRTDVALPDGRRATGKCAFYLEFDPPLSPFIEQRVEVRETWSAQVLPNGAQILPRPKSCEGTDAGMVPILLTSTGRTGTTLLMSEFARHPSIVIGDHFPYEVKQIAYLSAAFRTLAADADWERSTTPETMFSPASRHMIGSNPFNMKGLYALGGPPHALRNFWERAMPSGYATLFRSLILEFYATLANAHGKRLAPYFCEKSDIDDAAVQGARLFFGTVKDVVIIRDPRDLLCSAMAFWKLPPDTAMTMLKTNIPRVAGIGRRPGGNTIVIRYEDLIRDPLISRRRLSDFLQVDLLLPSLAKPDAIPDSHRTSADPGASIGRWRNDLTEDQIAACEVVFEQFMQDFDYAPARSRLAGTGRDKATRSILAAEGPLGVSAFAQKALNESAPGMPWLQTLGVTFGRDGNGALFTLDGWSEPERGFVWSCAARSRIRLPAIQRPGDYRLCITASPFTHGTSLIGQRVTVLLDEIDVGTAMASDICVLSIRVPESLKTSGRSITVTLRFPDAARPSDLVGIPDSRTLGFSLYRIALYRMESAPKQQETGSSPVPVSSQPAASKRRPARRTTKRDGSRREPDLSAVNLIGC